MQVYSPCYLSGVVLGGKLVRQSYFSSPLGLAILLGVLTIDDAENAGMLGYSEYRGCMVLNIRQFVLVP